MYCPMKFNKKRSTKICDRDECAWWIDEEYSQHCAIKDVALSLEDIRTFIDSIQSKM